MMWNPATIGEAKKVDDAKAEKIQKWEDQVSVFFRDTCLEFDLRALKYLRLKYPHQSTQLPDLERAITAEARKA